MMEFKTGNLFLEEAEALVNTVNCVGVMGRGIALQFKKAFPDNFKAYAAACKSEEVQPGKMFIFRTGELNYPKYIINFPTKRHWRGKSRIEDIEEGLAALSSDIERLKIKSIVIPPLGSGLGGLDWFDVRERIESALGDTSDVTITVFEPTKSPTSASSNRSSNVPNMTPGRASLVALMEGYLGGLLDPFVSLLEVHKLMYFLQESGESLKLEYRKATYGPYAENLRHVMTKIEGHFVSGYMDGGDQPDKQLEIVPGAAQDASKFLINHPETKQNLMKVFDLVEGFESSFGLELLASVHWILSNENATSIQDIKRILYAWNDRKRRFSEKQIQIAFTTLIDKDWISNSRSVN